MNRVLKKVRRVVLGAIGKRTWRDVEHFDQSWTRRIKEMAKYIKDGESVLDLGCGQMWLRQFLKKNDYYPVDYADRGEGTIICDFNKGEFPKVRSDVAFLSGTIEYITNVEWFVGCISARCKSCIVSYCLIEDNPNLDLRRKRAWVNDFSRDDIVRIFYRAGFKLASESSAIPANHIFFLEKSV